MVVLEDQLARKAVHPEPRSDLGHLGLPPSHVKMVVSILDHDQGGVRGRRRYKTAQTLPAEGTIDGHTTATTVTSD